MKVLLVNQSPGYLFKDIYNSLLSLNVDVEVIIGDSAFMTSKRGSFIFNAYDRRTNLSKFWSWLKFTIRLVIFIRKEQNNYDHILFTSNPPLIIFFSRILKVSYSVLIYDLYPRAFLAPMKISSSNIIYSWIKKLALRFYKNSSLIFVLSKEMREEFTKDFFEKSFDRKIVIAPLWFDKKIISEMSLNFSPRKFLGIQKGFSVLYSGNAGHSHPVEDIIFSSDYLFDLPISFYIFSSGSKFKKLKDLSKDRPNVYVDGLQSEDEFRFILRNTDIGFVTLEKDFSNLSIPSKTFNLLANSIPIIAICDENSSLARLIKDNNCGIVIKHKKPTDIAASIRKLFNSKSLRTRFATNSSILSKSYTYENSRIIASGIVSNIKT